MIDLIRAALDITGPADVTVATWSSGIRDGESAAWLLNTGAIRAMTWVVDNSFCLRQPEYVRRLRMIFGDDCVIATMIHAKFALIRNDEWSLAFRSSMNLNRNDRFEMWELDDSPAICDWLGGWVDTLFASHRTGWVKGKAETRKEFRRVAMGHQAGTIDAPVMNVSDWMD